MNKYIEDKSERTYKKLEANILKNVTSSNTCQKTLETTKINCLPNNQMSFSTTKKS